MNDVRASLARQGLSRPRDARVIAGVCSGVGRRFGLGPWVSRLLFVLLLMVVPGSQLLVYPVLWILMPNEDAALEGYEQWDGYEPYEYDVYGGSTPR